jgi:hypothetical protein
MAQSLAEGVIVVPTIEIRQELVVPSIPSQYRYALRFAFTIPSYIRLAQLSPSPRAPLEYQISLKALSKSAYSVSQTGRVVSIGVLGSEE